MKLQPSKQIDVPQWARRASTQKLMRVIGGEGAALFVGGCVRNTLLDSVVDDIDIATSLSPQQVINQLSQENIKTIPTGIDHGTVTAVIDGDPFEITTLRRDVSTDGRHAETAFTDDWVEDARRRDFTINTLLMDIEGKVYDPLGCALDDLENRTVIFVGDPVQRIAEDYLRILRFFRFHSFYGEGDIDPAGLTACQAAAKHIATLSRERITQEFLKILSSDKAAETFSLMFAHDVLIEITDKNFNEKELENLIDLQHQHNVFEITARLFLTIGCDVDRFENYLRLTHAQRNFLIKLKLITNIVSFDDERSIKKAIFYHGRDLVMQGYLLYGVRQNAAVKDNLVSLIKDWVIPGCPITGETLIAEGYQTGPELGQELERRKEEWLEGEL